LIEFFIYTSACKENDTKDKLTEQEGMGVSVHQHWENICELKRGESSPEEISSSEKKGKTQKD
jgi:hypothetical protein